jgi:RND superfamily putative drug exporter
MLEDYVHARRAGATRVEARALARGAVKSGFTSSARVVTAAALIMFAVFAAFVPEGDASLKPIALGLAVGIVIDAFLVRMTLTPAVMALLGARAWWLPKWLERVLPHFDIEGEAVERELALTDWPEPNTTAAVVGEAIEVRSGAVLLVADTDLRVEPGEALLVTASDARGPRALLLALAGRAPLAGRVRVGGHLMPGREAWVRTHVGVALLDGSTDPLRDIRRAVAGRTRIVVIDGLDGITGAARDQAAAVLRDAASVTPALAIVASSAHPEAASALLAEAGYPNAPVLDITVPAPLSPVLTTEVHA